MKSLKIICSFKVSPLKVCLSILLAGCILLGQGSDSRFQAEASVMPYFKSMKNYVSYGKGIVFGSGLCTHCHTFEEGEHSERGPNLFGIEKRSYSRIKEYRYLTEPILIGETDKVSGIVKGAPRQIPGAYSRGGSPNMKGEDYLRESLMCPSCYVVKGYGKEGDTKSSMPVYRVTKEPMPVVQLSWWELNAVIAFLQSMDTPGKYSRVTVPLATRQVFKIKEKKERKELEKQRKKLLVSAKACIDKKCVPQVINALGCPLCHTIPGVEGAVGELGPPLHQKIDAPRRIKDPRYKGKARTAREYVRESILNPNVYIVFNKDAGEPYPEGVMPHNYGKKLSIRKLELLVDFISNTEPE